MSHQDHIEDIIFDSFRGRLGGKRRKKLKAWLKASPANQAIFDQIRDRDWLLRQAKSPTPEEVSDNWEMIRKRIINIPPGSLPLSDHEGPDLHVIPVHHSLLRRVLWGAAAVVLIVIGLKLILQVKKKPEPTTPPIAQDYLLPASDQAFWSYDNKLEMSSDSTHKNGTVQVQNMRISDDSGRLKFQLVTDLPIRSGQGVYYKVHTPPGRTHGLVLPDGSTADMNAAASIKIPATYNKLNREVVMDGQNYFDVLSVTEGLAPFIVHVRPPIPLKKWFAGDDDLVVIATGTKFDIQANPTDSSILVLLSKGQLKIVRRGEDTSYLKEGNAYVLDSRGMARKLPMTEVKDTGSWREKEFSFEFEPAVKILGELGRWYDAKIIYLQKPEGLFLLRGARTRPIEYFLNQMKDESYFKYEMIKDTILVSR